MGNWLGELIAAWNDVDVRDLQKELAAEMYDYCLMADNSELVFITGPAYTVYQDLSTLVMQGSRELSLARRSRMMVESIFDVIDTIRGNDLEENVSLMAFTFYGCLTEALDSTLTVLKKMGWNNVYNFTLLSVRKNTSTLEVFVYFKLGVSYWTAQALLCQIRLPTNLTEESRVSMMSLQQFKVYITMNLLHIDLVHGRFKNKDSQVFKVALKHDWVQKYYPDFA